MFFGESMFSRESDASKVGFVHIVAQFGRWGLPLIDCQMPRLDDLGLQILKIRFIQVELPLQRPIGNPLMLLEESQDPLEYVIEVHHHPSRCP